MTDLSKTIIAKSDQLNADDLIGRSITIEIADVSGRAGEQPIAVHYKGDEGKPYLPCTSMRRVLVAVWGNNGKAYIGRRLTLYRDPSVKFGGIEVGGIRISHMSHIAKPITLALTAAKASKKQFTVMPLPDEPRAAELELSLADALHDIEVAPTLDGLKYKHGVAYRAFSDDESRAKIDAAKDKRKAELSQQPTDGGQAA